MVEVRKVEVIHEVHDVSKAQKIHYKRLSDPRALLIAQVANQLSKSLIFFVTGSCIWIGRG